MFFDYLHLYINAKGKLQDEKRLGKKQDECKETGFPKKKMTI